MVFITMVTAERKPIFTGEAIETIRRVFRNVKIIHPFRMKGYVFLPDHIHVLLMTLNGRFDQVIHSFKRNLSIELKKCRQFEGKIWQERYYDHVIRDDNDLYRHLDYIHYNPVHHGICPTPFDYPFTSFHAYMEKGWYTAGWGVKEPFTIQSLCLE
jgi:putative transposase